MCEVMRAPFWPSGSLAIWTMISWPSFSRSVIDGAGGTVAHLRLRRGHRALFHARLWRTRRPRSPAAVRGPGPPWARGLPCPRGRHVHLVRRGGACGAKRDVRSADPARAVARSDWWECGRARGLLPCSTTAPFDGFSGLRLPPPHLYLHTFHRVFDFGLFVRAQRRRLQKLRGRFAG